MSNEDLKKEKESKQSPVKKPRAIIEAADDIFDFSNIKPAVIAPPKKEEPVKKTVK